MTNLPKVPNNPILADVKRRLDLGPGYIPVDMRNDIVLLMNMVIHLDHVIDQMVEDPENEEKATAAGLRILHRSFQEELRNHDNTKNELKIAYFVHDFGPKSEVTIVTTVNISVMNRIKIVIVIP